MTACFLQALRPTSCFVPHNLLPANFHRNTHTQTYMSNVYTHITSRWAHAMTATFTVSLAPSSYSPSPSCNSAHCCNSFLLIQINFRALHLQDTRQGLPCRSSGSFLSLSLPCPFRAPCFRLSLPLYTSLT